MKVHGFARGLILSGLMAAKILALSDEALAGRLAAHTARQTDSVSESVEDA